LVEGWGTYPFDRGTIQDIAGWITGKPWTLEQFSFGGYQAVSHADPLLPAASAAAWLYQFHRWGDLYYQSPGGDVPISVEDTRGWLRQDVNTRFPLGTRTTQALRDWLRAKYRTIAAVNAAWGASFESFDEIDPDKDQVVNRFGHLWEYTNPSNPFHDWNDAVADLDTFRTELRFRNYRDVIEQVRGEIPQAAICVRTEGANVLVGGLDPGDPNPHVRHIYYSQRRCGLIAEIIQKSGVVKRHSDYTTIPYTPRELRELIAAAVSQGVVPAYLPQFDNMRDIAINARYGTEYQVHYNLPEPRKGYLMHVLTAAYPWWQATAEAGGVPGILWEDHQCDGFATETQKRELRLFKQHWRQALADWTTVTEAATASEPASDWRRAARALPSYHITAD
ncbi:MAG: beta-galactosidase, partial [Planctomycetes bacterium]|nr:beta-galactosidase [Planctomycetota bacterium]